jgi:ubiquinone biosynthesis protein COQ9
MILFGIQVILFLNNFFFFLENKDADFDWYIKRGGLITIYTICELYMLTDTSKNFKDTYEFVEKNLNTAVFAKSILDNLIGKHFKM